MLKSFVSALLGGVAMAQTPEERAAYPDYAEKFDKHGITWETMPVKTADGYTMTIFHLTGDADGPWKITRPSLLMQHGMGGSGIVWLETLHADKNVPMAFQFGRMGFDVWIANNSGVQYSQMHDKYTVNDKEFWLMDWSKYGVYDLPAVVAEMRKRNGNKKVTMIGHSQGTTQTFAGMGLIPEWYDQNISVAALMGPCTTPNDMYFKPIYTKELWECIQQQGVYVMVGPNWAADKAKLDANCSHIAHYSDAISSLEHLANNPTQALAAYAQTALSKRFQVYDPDWFNKTSHKNTIMDFGLVKEMQVAMFVGLWDNTCPLPVSQQIYEQLGGEANVSDWVVSPIQGHVPWGFSASPWFIETMSNALMKNADL